MSILDFAMLLVLAALWGASFLFIRIAVPFLGPTLLVDLRVFIAAFSLICYALVFRQRLQLIAKWKSYFVVGLINAAIPFSLISTSELHLSAALAAILNATTPMFTAVVARIWLQDALTWKKMLGLVLGIFGVIVAVGKASATGVVHPVLWVGCSLLAALAYALGGVYSARAFKGEKPLNLAIGQQLAAGIWLIPFVFVHKVHLPIPLSATTSILALAILSTGFGYILYFQLMQRVGPVKTMSVTFLVPIFGLVWSCIFLAEPLTWHLVLALVIILLSVSLVTNMRFKRQLHQAERQSMPEGD